MAGKVVLLGAAALVAGAIVLVASGSLGPFWRVLGIALIVLSLLLVGSAMVGGKRKGPHP